VQKALLPQDKSHKLPLNHRSVTAMERVNEPEVSLQAGLFERLG